MKQLSSQQKKLVQDAILAVLAVLFVSTLSLGGWIDYLNGKLFDLLVTTRNATPEHRDDIVFATIDQNSITYFHERNAVSWPWPRVFYARLLRHLADCGARVVVFDIILSEEDIDRTGEERDASDNEFARAIAETGIAVLAVSDQRDPSSRHVPEHIDWPLADTGPFDRCTLVPTYRNELLPYHVFLESAPGLGFVTMTPERDGIHRRYPLISGVGGRLVPSIALATAKRYLCPEEYPQRVRDPMANPRLLDDEGKMLINWYGMGGTDPAGIADYVFTYYSFHAIIASSIQMEMGEEPVIPPEAFRDKIVIVGSNAPGLFDLKSTPFTSQNIYPGMEIHATAIENLISGDYMYRVPGWVIFLLMVLVAGGLFAADRLFQNLRVFIGIFIAVIIMTMGAAYALILENVFFAAGEMLLTAGLVFVGLIVSGYFSESKDKRLLRRQFERYVNDTVLEEILANPDAVDVKGRTVNAAIMATDIADFTTISEQFPPHVVVSHLNDYLSEVSEALIDNGAFINKYIGDAILAVFGAFGERDYRRNACLAAVNATKIIQRQIEEARLEQRDPFVTRFGITSGELTIGNIGSARKTEFTVIGDSVNSAFRLEGLNKFYRTTILVSEHTKEGAGDEFEFRFLDVLRYKGKLTPVKIYELMSLKGELSEERRRWRDEFEQTLTFYQNREFERALTRFAELAHAGDTPSEVFRFRCEQFIAEPPPPDWNGVWVMLRK